ncbi:alpha/beta fold hydrolase [Flexivirga sp. ID2601S]|uniref:Alpha/beta fold hydrolase n=2 Tax=Flexivirga aerilata TaxID=1656889 RepID=A0A849AIX1_9MICO|nr:alpha/beta fold hydrolase [Flexivirga aerilata]NNG39923.1 alpha/beta fold hydrolase [Flexivirga aerilata]
MPLAVPPTVAAAAGGAAVGAAGYFVRQILTPEPPVDDLPVLAIDGDRIVLARTEESVAPGRYGLWQNGFQTHARLGEVLEVGDREVVRELDGVDFGTLDAAPARMNGYYFCGPPSTPLGVELRDAVLDPPLGPMPAWLAEAPGSNRWAVLVHGRGAQRGECLRAMRTLHALGINCLIPSYRNDIGAPASRDGRYHLGLSEWEDVEAALLYAVERGAREVQLFGWSMGGAVVLQLLDRSWLADVVTRVVLDAPVVSWPAVFDFHAGLNNLPRPIDRLGQLLMRSPLHRVVAGLGERLDLRRTDWVARSGELRVPILLIHSAVDEFVPFAPSAALAAARPDLVRLERWNVARHCREWNVDPARWERLVAEFCSG